MSSRVDFTILFTPDDDPWQAADERDRQAYFHELGKIAVEVKRNELLQGLDKDGRPLAPVHSKRKDRASGPPLCPHGRESRTVRLLDFAIVEGGVRLHWPAEWSRILGYHAEGVVARNGEVEPVRDVIGVSPEGRETVRRLAIEWWRSRSRRS